MDMTNKFAFDADLAKRVGVRASIVYEAIYNMCKASEKLKVNFYDGYYWASYTTELWESLFPFMKRSELREAVRQLNDYGFIKQGRYGKTSADCNIWFTILVDINDKEKDKLWK